MATFGIFTVIFLVAAVSGKKNTKECPELCVKAGQVHQDGVNITVHCNEGFRKIDSKRRIRCKVGEENIKVKIEFCEKAVYCPGINGINRGYVTTSGETYNEPEGWVKFSCEEGFRLTGDKRIRCSQHGTWDFQTKPKCERYRCDLNTIQILPYGNVTVDNYVLALGTKATFKCNAGYRFKDIESDEYTITCRGRDNEHAPEWNGDKPTCIKHRCKHIERIKNGYLDQGSYSSLVGGEATVICHDGYKLASGSGKVTCDGSEISGTPTWSGDIPSCVEDPDYDKKRKAFCDFIHLENGKKTNEKRKDGDIIKFECKPGYDLVGDKTIKCIDGISYDKEPPICVEKQCQKISYIENANVSMSNTPPYAVTKHMNAKCATGTSSRIGMTGDRSITCTLGSDGNLDWDEIPSCSVKTCDMETPGIGITFENGKILEFRNRRYDEMDFVCNHGYVKNKEKKVRCSSELKWENIPECLKETVTPTCEVPCVLFAKNSTTETKKTTTVTYQCEDGFKLEGNATLNCTDGKWDSGPPTCTEIDDQEDDETELADISKCTPAKMFIIFDLSKSLSDKQVDYMREGAQKMMKRFSRHKSPCGVITYGKDVTLEHPLIERTEQEIDGLKLLTRSSRDDVEAGTSTSSAMLRMMDEFKKARTSDQAEIAILNTDGKATESLHYMIEQLNNSKINAICVGVGRKFDKTELEAICGSDHVVNVTKFKDFEKTVSKIISRVCVEVPTTPTPTTTTVASDTSATAAPSVPTTATTDVLAEESLDICLNKKMCIWMVIDISRSVSEREISALRCAARQFILQTDLENTKIGVMKFNSFVETEIKMGEQQARAHYFNGTFLTRALLNATDENGEYIVPKGTRTDLALTAAYDEFENLGDSPDCEKKIIVCFTDGKPTARDKQMEAAYTDDRRENYEIFAVGIGKDAKYETLERIASDPDYVVQTHNFTVLKSAATKVMTKVCSG